MGKTILVTGGNRGIGLEICKELSEAGHTVLLGSRSVDSGREASRDFIGKIDVVKLDVTNVDDIDFVAEYIKTRYKILDVLINNAGIGIGNKEAISTDIEEAKQTMDTNFYGAWRLSKSVFTLLKSSGGRIINISSGMGALGDLDGGYAGYRLSKSSLNALTILMANELRGSGIKVNAMCPGWVRTDMGGAGASRSIEQGADTAVWLATHPEIQFGKFFRDRKIIPW